MNKLCETCRKPFNAPGRRNKYCGWGCYQESKQDTPAKREARFWEKVAKAGPDDCWVWMAYCQRFGHGIIGIGYQTVLAHRYSWELVNGPVPDGKCVLHNCDNPPCVNPAHLHLGDRQQNYAEAIARNRIARGERTKRNRLVADQVLEIRREYREEKRPGTRSKTNAMALARKYGVSRNAIVYAATGQFWKHVK